MSNIVEKFNINYDRITEYLSGHFGINVWIKYGVYMPIIYIEYIYI